LKKGEKKDKSLFEKGRKKLNPPFSKGVAESWGI